MEYYDCYAATYERARAKFLAAKVPPPFAKQGEVSASYADGGVMSPKVRPMTPPSACEADTSPAKLGRKR